jgi:hypothetical protein
VNRFNQSIWLALGYGLAAMVLASAISTTMGVVAAGVGGVLGVVLHRWHIEERLRSGVPLLVGLVLVLLGLWLPAWLGRGWWFPTLLGITVALTMIQTLTLLLVTAGFVMVTRSLSNTVRVLSMLDGLVIISAICLRFAAHRNYNWSNPRFFSDWAGIQGYELPVLFAILGFAALSVGLIAGMQPTSGRHATISVVFMMLMLALLLWLGGSYLRNPSFELVSGSRDVGASPTSASGADDMNDTGSNSSDSSPSNQIEGKQNDGTAQDDAGQGEAQSGQSAISDQAQATGAAMRDASSDSAGNKSSQNNSSGSASSPSNEPLPSAASQRNSPQPIALVLLEEDVEPYEKVWYFRQTAVSLFNGKRLVTASDDRFDTDIPSSFSDQEEGIGGIPLPVDMHKIVPLVVNLIADQPRPFSLPSMISFAPLPNPDTQYFRRSFRATSCVLTNPVEDGEIYDLYATLCHHYQPGNAEWGDEERKHYTQVPEDPRYKELAEQIVAERMLLKVSDELKDSAMLKALSVKRWLEENTTYSLHPRFDDAAANPAEQFLFGERHGYCTHIAHASVYLMRSLGLPARIGVGYMVPTERSGKSSAILIQSTDAHAWAEIYLQDAGWIVVDAMPEKIDESTQLAPEPDPTLSQYLADKARNKNQHQTAMRETTEYSRGFPLRLRHIPWIMLWGVVALYVVKIWIVLSPRFTEESSVVRITQRATILRLAEAGIQRGFGETRSEFADRLASTFPEFAKLTEHHVRSTYGHGVAFARDACLEVQKQTHKRIRRTTGLLRRVIGRLDPRFWVFVR